MSDDEVERLPRLTDEQVLNGYLPANRKEHWPTHEQVAEWLLEARMWNWR